MHAGMLAVQEKELLRLLLRNTSLCLFAADSGERSHYYCKSRGPGDVTGAVHREFKLEHQSMQQICTSAKAASQAWELLETELFLATSSKKKRKEESRSGA